MTEVHVGCCQFSRRVFVATGATTLLLGGHRAFAQEIDISSLAKEVISGANEVLQFAINAPMEEINSGVASFVELDFTSRQKTFNTLRQSGISSNIEAFNNYIEELPASMEFIAGVPYDDIALNSVKSVVAALEDENLPLIPSEDAVEPTAIPSIPPTETDDDSDLLVAVDIILEGFGLADASLLVDLIQSDPEIETMFSDLVAKISTKEWEAVAELLEKILRGSVIPSILSKLGKKAKRRFLFGLALRAVPFAGWLYSVASILIALKSNYHRFSFA